MLRAVRFAAQLNFEIEPQTFAAIQLLAPKIKIISAERVRDELLKLFAPPQAERINGLMDEWIGGESAHGDARSTQKSNNPAIQQSNSPAARGLVLLRDSGLLEHILPVAASRSAVTGLAMSCNNTAHGSDSLAPAGIFSSIRQR